MMKKCIALLALVLLVVSGCEKEESLLPNEGVLPTTGSEAKVDVSEDIDIDEAFLQERYPGKKILTWVYGESWKITEKDMETYGEKYGKKYLTNNQVIRLNDYLASKGKDYIINYVKLDCGEEYISEVNKMVEQGNAPDFISAGVYNDFDAEVFTRALAYDFIGQGMFEDLTPYLDNELRDYKKSVPQNVFDSSRFNDKFYGINQDIYNISYYLNWYVNTDIADKYGINLENIESMDYEDWEKYCDIVYQGEKKAGTKDFRVMDTRLWSIETYESSTKGYIGELNGNNYFKTSVFGIDLTADKIMNYYADPEVKKEYKTYANYYQKGYLNYLNPTKENEEEIYDGNIFLFSHADYTVENTEEDVILESMRINYSQLKNIKKIPWKKSNVNQWETLPYISGICSASGNKASAIDALNIIYSDKEIANIIMNPYYEAGSNTKKTEEEVDEFYYSNEDKIERLAGLFTNKFLVDSIIGARDDNIAELVDSIDMNSNFAGRLYDYTPIEKEVRELKKIEEKYVGSGSGGKFRKGDFEENWNNFMKELDAAGMDKALEYLNSYLKCDENEKG